MNPIFHSTEVAGQFSAPEDSLKSAISKLQGLSINDPQFSKEVQARLAALKYFQDEHAQLELKFTEEFRLLEEKYAKLYQPIYDKRTEIVKGIREPSNEELKSFVSSVESSNVISQDSTQKGIPNFWLTTLKNHSLLAEMISEGDEGALRCLVDIRSMPLEDNGFRLDFEFAQNEFFSNTVLSKSYIMKKECHNHDVCGDIEFDHAEGCQINWKDGKNLTVHTVTKVQRHKKNNTTRTIKREEPQESFFNFFNPPVIPENDEEIDEAEVDELNEKLTLDYQIGDTFKSTIIPQALNWFLGISHDEFDEDYEDEEEMDEDDDDYDYDQDSSDEDQESDDDEDEVVASKRAPVHSRNKGKHAGVHSKSNRIQVQEMKSSSHGPEQPPQCKQQ